MADCFAETVCTNCIQIFYDIVPIFFEFCVRIVKKLFSTFFRGMDAEFRTAWAFPRVRHLEPQPLKTQ